MLSPDRFQEVLKFAEGIARDFECKAFVNEYQIPKSDVSTITVQFSTHGMKIGRVFGDADLQYCRLPVGDYISRSLGSPFETFKIQCESNRRDGASAVK